MPLLESHVIKSAGGIAGPERRGHRRATDRIRQVSQNPRNPGIYRVQSERPSVCVPAASGLELILFDAELADWGTVMVLINFSLSLTTPSADSP